MPRNPIAPRSVAKKSTAHPQFIPRRHGYPPSSVIAVSSMAVPVLSNALLAQDKQTLKQQATASSVPCTKVEKFREQHESKASSRNAENPWKIHFRKILNAVTEARKPTQQQLRKQIEDLCHHPSGRQNPLHLFPQEIWVMILKNANVTDLGNFSITCPLFKSIIHASDQEILFVKVLPIVFPYFGNPIWYKGRFYGETKTEMLIKCGRVCKKWRAGVDYFAKSYFRIKNPLSCGVDKLGKEPVNNFKDMEMLCQDFRFNPWESNSNGDTHYDVLKIGRNPFLGIASIRLAAIEHEPTFLKLKGNVIAHLVLKIGQVKVYTSRSVFSLCNRAIQKCPNLKSLCLCVCDTYPSTAQILQNGAFGNSVHPQLESLTVLIKVIDILQIQDGLVTSFSSQLKRVQLQNWNLGLYHLLDWKNLVDLMMLDENCLGVLPTLQLIPAPKLYQLHLCLDTSCQDFVAFFQCINTFPSLRHLSIALTDVFCANVHQKILDVPLDLLTTNRIITLEVIRRNLGEARDVPLLFPLVRSLVYRSENRSETLKNSFAESEIDELHDACSTEESHVIQLHKNMNKSNIWSLFPLLETLEMDCIDAMFTSTRYYRGLK